MWLTPAYRCIRCLPARSTKNILQSCLTKGALSVQGGQKRDGLFPAVEVVAFCPFRCFLIYGVFAQAVDQARWSIDLLQLSVIHKCYPVAERLCLFHIVGCKKNSQVFFHSADGEDSTSVVWKARPCLRWARPEEGSPDL